MEELKNQIIEVTNNEGFLLKMTLSWDAGLTGEWGIETNSWVGAFRTILYWLGFGREAIDEYLPTEENEEVKDSEE